MCAVIIDGKTIAAQLKEELRITVKSLQDKQMKPTLAVVLIGKDPASRVYVSNKKKACEYVGIHSLSYELDENVSEEEVLSLINELNQNKEVNGILVQLPLPRHISEDKVITAIDPSKDVDGFHPVNVGALSIGRDGFVSCTPAGIIELLKRSSIPIQGKHCVVVGRSNIVGKPISMLLLQEHGTVTICHSRTKNLEEITKQGDIIIAAVGRAKFITGSMIKEGAVVVDVGINRLEDGKLCGDVDFESCREIASAITPVPGGVGPMTIAMLLHNCVKACSMQNS